LLKGIGFGADEESIRVVSQMPRWKPGSQSGKAVNVRYNLPINFSLEDDSEKKTSFNERTGLGQYEHFLVNGKEVTESEFKVVFESGKIARASLDRGHKTFSVTTK
ncbi:MAG: energy transducer TonB, partial [Spirosoma sp.]|nr:energy transducer TonB [Spirosoma sp.]